MALSVAEQRNRHLLQLVANLVNRAGRLNDADAVRKRFRALQLHLPHADKEVILLLLEFIEITGSL